jgi:hypothetical protein
MASSESASCSSLSGATIGGIVAGVCLTMIFIVLIVGILLYKSKTLKTSLDKTTSAAVDLHRGIEGENELCGKY